MGRHPNAKLTPRGRKTLVPRMESGAPIVDAARQMGVGRQTVSKWLPRSRPGEAPSDRNGRTRRLEKSTPVARSRPLRYERERPGELVHVDVKKTARIPDGGGQRALGRGCVSADGARRRACTSLSTTAAGSPTPSYCPTIAGAPALPHRALYRDRPHSAYGDLPSMSRIVGVNNLSAHNT